MTEPKSMTMEEQAHKYVLQKERMKESNRLWRLAHKDDEVLLPTQQGTAQ
jgi:hypothetical protein